MTITFYNEAPLPLECITTFGVSVKQTDSPIGYFGTGLKYAIAVLLREGCAIQLGTDQRLFSFEVRNETVRGKDFQFIYMVDELNQEEFRLPFTTELGKNWKLWQAYRELWSNCQDEGGTLLGPESHNFESTGTAIVVDGLDEIHAERTEFLLQGEAFQVMGDVEIHHQPGIFYKGIRVAELGSFYGYNLKGHLSLTEDRTVSQFDAEWEIVKALVSTKNVDAILTVLSVEGDFLEGRLNFQKYHSPSETFMQFVNKMRKKPEALEKFYGNHYPAFVAQLPKATLSRAVQKKLTKLTGMLDFVPESLTLAAMEENYRVSGKSIVLNAKLLTEPKKLPFFYLLGCFQIQHARIAVDTIAEHMLDYFDFDNRPAAVEKEKAA
jgi:hypothetical protein